MKKSFIIATILLTPLLSACQNQAAPTTYNAADGQSKQEKATAESKVSITVGDESGNNSAPAVSTNSTSDTNNVTVK